MPVSRTIWRLLAPIQDTEHVTDERVGNFTWNSYDFITKLTLLSWLMAPDGAAVAGLHVLRRLHGERS